MNVIDYNPWDTGTAAPTPNVSPYSPPMPPQVPPPQPQVTWVYGPPIFTVSWELAALKAYEAMEAYYVALREKLEAADTHETERS